MSSKMLQIAFAIPTGGLSLTSAGGKIAGSITGESKGKGSSTPAATTAPTLPTIETGVTATEEKIRQEQRRRMGRSGTILTGAGGAVLGVGSVQSPGLSSNLGGV